MTDAETRAELAAIRALTVGLARHVVATARHGRKGAVADRILAGVERMKQFGTIDEQRAARSVEDAVRHG